MSQRTIETILFLGALLLAGLATHAYLVSRSEEQKLQATLASQNQIISDANTRLQQRDTGLASILADIAKQKAAKQSPQELVDALATVLALPEPIHLVPGGVDKPLNASDAGNGSSRKSLSGLASVRQSAKPGSFAESSPASPSLSASDSGGAHSGPKQTNDSPPTFSLDSSRPSDLSQSPSATQSASPEAPCPKSSKCPREPQPAELPAADLKPLYDFALDCRACQAQLAVAKQNAADDAAKIAALTRERDAAVTAAKGGTWLRRLRRDALWFAVGAATAYAAPHH